MKWTVHSRRRVYSSSWVDVWLDKVQPGDSPPFEHHVLRMPKEAVSIVVSDGNGRVLLLWRHRFATDAWGWEVPAGWAEPGEDLAEAAKREVIEETGWCPSAIEPLLSYNTLSGISSMRMHAFLASGVTQTTSEPDATESTRIEWIPLSRVVELARSGEIVDGTALTALMFFISMQLET